MTRVPKFLREDWIVNHGLGAYDLLLLLLLVTTLLGLSSLGLLSAHATGASATEGRGKGEVDVLLGVKTDDERGDVHDLLADANWCVSGDRPSELIGSMHTGCDADG